MEALTDRKVASIKPGTARLEIKDKGYPLFLVVQPSGVKSFQFRGKLGSKRGRHVIGQYPMMTLAAARDAALALKNGAVPERSLRAIKANEPAAPTGPTVSEAFGRYMRDEGDGKKSADEKWRIFQKDIEPKIGTTPLVAVTRLDLAKIVADKFETSPSMSNAVQRLLGRFFNWCLQEGWSYTQLESNPMQHVKKLAKPVARERALDEAELKLFFRALPAAGEFAPVFETLLRTITRRGDVFGLTWAMVKEDKLDFPETKNGLPHVVWLHPSTEALLGERGKDDERVFKLCVEACSNPVDRLNEKVRELAKADGRNAPVARFTLHDFRRTATSIMASWMDEETGTELVTPFIQDRLLNHIDSSVRGRHYNRYNYFAQKKAAMKLWCDYLDRVKAEALS